MARKKAASAADDHRPRKPNSDCTRCPLGGRGETTCCRSRGPKDASLYLYGEALGQVEDDLGRAFVGDAGRKLNYALSRSKLKRKEIRIGNVVRCNPPKNRTPNKKELVGCWPYTLYEILSGKPKVIVALGATAWRALLPHHTTKDRLDKWRGFPERYTFSYTTPKGKRFEHTCWVVATFHPANCLRDWEKDDLLIRDLEVAAEYAKGNIVLKHPTTKVDICETVADVELLCKKLKRQQDVVVDLETQGKDPHKHKVRCIGFCFRKGEAHIVPMLKKGGVEYWTREEKRRVLELLKDLFASIKIVGQGLKFDVQFLRALLGQIDYDIAFDTNCAAHVVDENKPNNLTFLLQWYLRWAKYDAAIQRFAQYDAEEGAYANAPDEPLWQYCGYDVDGTYQLRAILEKLVLAHKVLVPYGIEQGLILPLADVEYRGVHLDRKGLIKAADGYRKAQFKTRESLVKTCVRVFKKKNIKRYCEACGVKEFDPREFNPNSPDQVVVLMLAAGAKLRKKTAGGKLSTDKNVMAFLAMKKDTPGSIARRLRLMRSLTKYKSTYFDGNDAKKTKGGFLGLIKDHDRVHTNYFITVARTGRLSAKDPPLQTVPRVDPASALGYPVSKEVSALVKPRALFLPDVPGEHVLLEVDYAKVELCVMAWLAADEIMVKELLPGAKRDLHTNMAITARLLRNPTWEEYKRMSKLISKNERAVAKGVNFGIPYGRGDRAIAEANPSSFPLAMPMKMRVAKVAKVIKAWLDKYEAIADWREDQIEAIRRQGYLRDWLGRRRLLTGIRWFRSRFAEDCSHTEHDEAHMEREAMNFPIQSLASGLHNRATRKCYDGIAQSKIPAFRIVMTLHDSLIFNVHKRYVDEAQAKIKGWMELTLPKQPKQGRRFEMPLVVDATPCEYWGQHD